MRGLTDRKPAPASSRIPPRAQNRFGIHLHFKLSRHPSWCSSNLLMCTPLSDFTCGSAIVPIFNTLSFPPSRASIMFVCCLQVGSHSSETESGKIWKDFIFLCRFGVVNISKRWIQPSLINYSIVWCFS